MERFDVVVVGAGPTGLLLASELVLGGAKVVVLERLKEIDRTEKAGGLGVLAAEALVRRGLGPALDAAEAATQERSGTRAPNVDRMEKVGGHFARLLHIDQSRQREPDRRFRAVDQQQLEGILNEHARTVGVELRRGTPLTAMRVADHGVVVNETIEAAWLVGCDGGRSPVRKLAGFAFEGTEPTVLGRQAVVEVDHPERLLPLGWRRTPRGMIAYGPAPGRIATVELRGPLENRDAEITKEEVEASIRSVSGADVRVLSMERATRWTDHARLADSYKIGRVLLAGDAAHVHSPLGGQGLNLGLLDAVNLGWKLAGVVRGDSAGSILETYTTERRPVAVAVLEITRAQAALMRPDEQTSALREIVARLMDTDDGTRFFGEMMSGVRNRYDLGDDHPLVGTLSRDLADVVVATSNEQEAVAREFRVRVTRGEEPRYARPDGCIAWAGGERLREALARWAPRARD
jgi:2-polyprenyl-6-methoxyphenol hydroxylase-like FAD-dependent oxidoreductase